MREKAGWESILLSHSLRGAGSAVEPVVGTWIGVRQTVFLAVFRRIRIAANGKGQCAAAVCKRPIPDECDTVRDRDGAQAAAAIKRMSPDKCDAVRDRDGVQAVAGLKRMITDGGNAFGDEDIGQ